MGKFEEKTMNKGGEVSKAGVNKIEGELYVEGGPKCWEDFFSPHEHNHPTDCWTCHGTNLLPLSAWTDAQKAEWLGNKISKDIFLNVVISRTNGTSKRKMWFVFVEDDGGNMIGETLGEAEGFSAALTTAVECVAKDKE